MDLRPQGPGDHPHLAVRHGGARALRARLAAVDATPRSTAGSSTRTARRCRRARATWSRRCRCSSSTAPTRSATGPRNGRPGTDTALDEGQMKVGRRLAIKLLNASKFALGVIGDARHAIADGHRAARPFDARRARATSCATCTDRVRRATTTRARSSGPSGSSGTFCDDYLELVKQRAYGDDRDERRRLGPGRAPDRALDGMQRLFAPVPLLRDRRGVVVVAGRIGAPTSRGRSEAELRALRGTRPTLDYARRRARCSARCAR